MRTAATDRAYYARTRARRCELARARQEKKRVADRIREDRDREKHKASRRATRAKKPAQYNAKDLRSWRAAVDLLSDNYIRDRIVCKSKILSHALIPQSLVDLKREQLRLTRLTRKIKQNENP